MSTNLTSMEIPKAQSNYLKQTELTEEPTKVRILSDFIDGYLDWADNKPVRYRKNELPKDEDGKEIPAKNKDGYMYFLDCVVRNYNAKKIQVFEIKSLVLQKKLQALAKDEDRGEEMDYDLKFTKTGKDKTTKYEVTPANKWPLTEELAGAYIDAWVNLEALYDGADPFAK